MTKRLKRKGYKRKMTDLPEGFVYPDAFRVMTYRCEQCGEKIKVWNSRNGVTPFCVTCVSCRSFGSMIHIDWNHDYRADVKPDDVEWIFAGEHDKPSFEHSSQEDNE